MKRWHGSRVQESIINLLDKQERHKSFKIEKFFRYKFNEIHNRLYQELIESKIVETQNPAAVSELLLRGLKKLVKSTEFEFRYFVAPIRNIVPQPNPYSLFMAQYIIEEIANDPSVEEVYGTDDEIYRLVDKVMSSIKDRFETEEEEILRQLANQKNLVPGSREYELALENMLKKKFGEPQKF